MGFGFAELALGSVPHFVRQAPRLTLTLFSVTVCLPVIFQEVLQHWDFFLNINLER
jgi:hypothetical protein